MTANSLLICLRLLGKFGISHLIVGAEISRSGNGFRLGVPKETIAMDAVKSIS
jgi:hypothetical protein